MNRSLPDSWQWKSLREVAAINYGKSAANVLSDDGEIPVVGTGGVERYGSDYLYDGASIILGRKGTIDKVTYVEGRFWPIDTAYFLSAFKDRASVGWLYYFLQTVDLRSLNEATGVPSLSREILYKLMVPTPCPEEQEKIAETLTALDRAIEQTEAVIFKQQRIRTGLMQELLTKGVDENGNIRSEATHSFKDSMLGRIPVEWDVCPAENLCEAVIDCKNRTPPETVEGHPVIRTPNVRNGEFVSNNLAFTDSASYEVWTARGRPRAGDVVITREAPFGEACIIPDGVLAPCLGQRMMMYQPDASKIRADYLVYAIYSQRVQQRLLELAGGSTVGHVRVGDIRALPIPHPVDVKEQERITLVLNGISAALKDELISQSKLASLRTGLIHDLLTGERRVTPLFAQADAQ